AARVGAVVAERSSAISEAVADVILLQGGVESLPFLYAKARQTVRVVKQGIVLAMLTLLGSAIPAGLGIIPLWFTVLLHEGQSRAATDQANTDNFNDSARQHEEKATDLYPGEQRCRPSHPTHVDDMAQLLEATAKETADMAALDATAEYYATIYEEERRLLYQRGFPLETPYGSVGSEGKVN
ncbi:putative cadmium/zinc-transporting ATPase hma1, chloroplastic, partial [Cymbomonas tetramitiformis]